jgi:hypothetical protein
MKWSGKIYRVSLDVSKDLGPVSLVFPPVMDNKIVLSQADYFAMPRSDGAEFWMPNCSPSLYPLFVGRLFQLLIFLLMLCEGIDNPQGMLLLFV